mmetsp:Transcript_28899/g.70445  ORF Transcript_28899/g.70445 Transcript_28899/m.70445 type:complete len:245 (+) Transcript_28899:395-1129(+)
MRSDAARAPGLLPRRPAGPDHGQQPGRPRRPQPRRRRDGAGNRLPHRRRPSKEARLPSPHRAGPAGHRPALRRAEGLDALPVRGDGEDGRLVLRQEPEPEDVAGEGVRGRPRVLRGRPGHQPAARRAGPGRLPLRAGHERDLLRLPRRQAAGALVRRLPGPCFEGHQEVGHRDALRPEEQADRLHPQDRRRGHGLQGLGEALRRHQEREGPRAGREEPAGQAGDPPAHAHVQHRDQPGPVEEVR